MKSTIPLCVAILLALSACGQAPAPDPAVDAPADAPDESFMDAPDAPPPLDQPEEEIPPATISDAGRAAGAAQMPAEGVIGFDGFGPAPFGADQEAVRIAWGRDLGDAAPDEPGGCHYLTPQPLPEDGYRIAFMIEGDRFARIDVKAADIPAPGGGHVGMAAAEIRALYGEGVEELPHKYVDDAHYLRIADPDGGDGVLLFETDESARVTQWRIGVPPQVDYVEGCS